MYLNVLQIVASIFGGAWLIATYDVFEYDYNPEEILAYAGLIATYDVFEFFHYLACFSHFRD